MIRVNGKSVYRGIAVGPAVVLKNEDFQIKRRKISDVEAEIRRVKSAVKQAQEQLSNLYGVCQVKCVSFIKFPYRQFSKLPVLHAESTLLIFENACLHLIIHGKLITYECPIGYGTVIPFYTIP